MYINFWYPIARSTEVTAEKPLKVTLLTLPFVAFRDQSGQAHDFFQMDYPAASWLFRSIGPGRVDVNTSDGFGIEDIYDATNGTISRGNIVFAGPGISVIGR